MTITSAVDCGSNGTVEGSGEVTAATQIVMDTSALVANPDAIFDYPGDHIVLPLTVIEELDDLKTRGDEVGWAARTVIRSLEEHRIRAGGDLAQPVQIDELGGTLRIALNGLRLERLEELRLDPSKEDNRILAAAIGVAEDHDRVTLISADGSLRIKAAAVGIGAEDGARDRRHANDALLGRPITIDVTDDVLSDLYAHHSVPADRLDADLDLDLGRTQNQAVVLRSGSSSALGRIRGTDIIQVRTDVETWGLRGRSKEQHFALDLLCDPDVSVVTLTGHAGVGKTLLALAAGLEQTIETGARYDQVMILRPVVPVGGQDLGFLPGDLEEKLGPWFEAITDAIVALGDNVSHREAKAMLDGWVHDGQLVTGPVTHLRGRSLQRTWVLADEVQNLEPSVARTILTRLGEGSKAVMVGDTTQIDSPFLSESTNALSVLCRGLAGESLFGHVALQRGERSPIADLAATRL